MKKRLLSLLLVGALLCTSFSLTACKKKEEKTLVCGVTIYEPMNFQENGDWTGFDTEFARLVGEKLDMKVTFQEIKWESKYAELESGAINCIWNGFTANSSDEGKPRSEYVDFSYSYMLNQQCVVVKKSDQETYATADSLKGKKAAAEKGSAGESVAKDLIGDDGSLIDAPAQTNTLIEVKSGAVDFAVMDILLAEKTVGKGNYEDLVIAEIELPSEVYAIGFKKGSDLKDKVNQAMKELFESGEMTKLAEKYKLENSLVLDTDFAG